MARKIRGFERVLDAPALFAVAYGEVGSSIYFALGIVVATALGLTPIVLLTTGVVFLLVALSYAEGTAAIPETGGAETFARRAFNDLVGFFTGWALFLDYLIVIALSALFMPHYLSAALGIEALGESPGDLVVAVGTVAAVAAVRLVRRARLYTVGLAVALLDLAVQGLVVLLGLAFLFSPEVLTEGFDLAPGQGLSDVLFAVPLGMLAYTGLETVANLAEEAREPGRTLPRSLFSAIGLVVVLTVLVSVVAVTAFPASDGSSQLADDWLEAPIVGIVTAFDGELPAVVVDMLRVVVGLSGALILFTAVTTSLSGSARLAHSMGEHGMLPRELGRLERRTLVSREAIVAIAAVAIGVILVTGLEGSDFELLASVFSFGVLLAFTIAQVAVIRLRLKEPELPRPFRARPEIVVRGTPIPLPALVGAALTFAIWILAMVTHPGARYVGPAWLVVGLAVFLITRALEDRSVLGEVSPVEVLPLAPSFHRVLVPMKAGHIGEEMMATAVALAKDRDAEIQAITVVRVPRRFRLEGPLPPDVAARTEEAMEEARALGEDHGLEVKTEIVRARSIGHAIVDEAARRHSDLIVLGSSPRWRRQSRFFSPTVDHVLKNATCDVLVVAFPTGVFEDSEPS
jgi:APA family basic amino acid/polyamine antiporter